MAMHIGSKRPDGDTGTPGNTIVIGGIVGDLLNGTPLDDILHGGDNDDTLNGGDGNDTLYGGLGADTMNGGAGNDTIYANGADTVDGGTGDDHVVFDLSYVGGGSFKGGPGTDTLVFNAAVFDYGTRAATFTGFEKIADNGLLTGTLNDDVLNLSGIKELTANAVNFRIFGGAGNDMITGGVESDIIDGGTGNDTLNGGGGTDTLIGGLGNDSYYVDNAGDQVFEAPGGGVDRVFATVSYTLGSGQEIERLQTTSSTGTQPIALTGNDYAQIIQGNAGANILDGKGGADSLYGFGGNDTYYVDNVGDKTYEAIGGGTDRVLASVSYALTPGQEIEKLATTDEAGTGAINLTGNGFAQIIEGNAGANILDGKGGADSLYGFGGNDSYYVDNAGDKVFEAANGGDDRVLASVSYTLDAGQEIERLSTTTSVGTANINLTGNEYGQIVQGNAGANVIDGKGGADILYGFGGADTFVFSTALGGGNIDKIADFNPSNNTIALSHSVFSQAGAVGALDASAFKVLGVAGAKEDADDRILYDARSGALYYDADGAGGAAAVHFATLSSQPTITAQDFALI